MRTITLSSMLAFFVVLSLASPCLAKQYVLVKKPFANVYEFLDPKSSIIEQSKKGDHLDLVYEGTSWYQVKVADKVGWIEKRAGEVVNQSGGSPVIPILLILLIAGGTIGTVGFYINKNRSLGA